MRFLALSLLGMAAYAGSTPIGTLEARQSPSALTASQKAWYKPYSWYAAAAYCPSSQTKTWTCKHCGQNPGFKVINSGGDGGTTQYWYVGYDSGLKTIIAGFQGTQAEKIAPLVTNADFFLDPLEASLFPGVSRNIKTHDGFGEAQKRSAAAVLAAVKQGMSTYSTKSVTLVGHSLGGAIATINAGYLSVALPSDTKITAVTYGTPRVGNEEFVNWINPRADIHRVNNKKDPIAIVPGRFMGFSHTEGEVHIANDGTWYNCPGTDSTASQCTISAVPNILVGNLNDHSGPFDGVMITCD